MADRRCRHLVPVLGDQLDAGALALRDLDPARDRVWMCEAVEESTHVPAHKARILLFLSAMRHFRDALEAAGIRVHYRALDAEADPSLAAGLAAAIRALRPERLILTEPGEHRVLAALHGVAEASAVPLEIRSDEHFICSRTEFDRWASGRKGLRLEHFYRFLRKREDILMEGPADDAQPVGGQWNLDQENRKSFGRQGPGMVPEPIGFPPDAITRGLIALIQQRFPNAPGSLERFDWPVTAAQAREALDDFIRNRLPAFGPWQDAMWTGEPYLYHARISAALNLKLLDPRTAIDAAIAASRRTRHRLRRSKASSARSSVGASTCAGSIGARDRFISKRMSWRHIVGSRIFTGPARPNTLVSRRRSDRYSNTVTAIISNA